MQVGVPVAQADVHLQRLAQPQRTVQPEPQQHAVRQTPAALTPPRGRVGDLGLRRVRQVAVEAAAIGQDRLGRHRSGRTPVQLIVERVSVIAPVGDGLFGDLLQPDHLVRPAGGERGHVVDVCGVVRKSGVHQPIRHSRRAQKQLRQIWLGECTTALPVVVGARVRRPAQQWRAAGTHRKPELRVEAGVEVGERLGVGLVERVLEPAPVPRVDPAAVHVMVDEA